MGAGPRAKVVVLNDLGVAPLSGGSPERPLAAGSLAEEEKLEADSEMEALSSGGDSARRLNKGKFTAEEDDKVAELVARYGEGSWSLIAQQMEGRNRKQIRGRYMQYIKPKLISPEFNAEEDTRIMDMVRRHGRKWHLIAKSLKRHTAETIKSHYYAQLAPLDQRRSADAVISSSNESNEASSSANLVDSPSEGAKSAPALGTMPGPGRGLGVGAGLMQGREGEQKGDSDVDSESKMEGRAEGGQDNEADVLLIQERKLRSVLARIQQKIVELESAASPAPRSAHS